MKIKSSKEVTKVNDKTNNVYVPTVLNTIHEKGEAQTIEKKQPKTLVSDSSKIDKSVLPHKKQEDYIKTITEQNRSKNKNETLVHNKEAEESKNSPSSSTNILSATKGQETQVIVRYKCVRSNEFQGKVKNIEINCKINGEKVNNEHINIRDIINQKFLPGERKTYTKHELLKKRQDKGKLANKETIKNEFQTQSNLSNTLISRGKKTIINKGFTEIENSIDNEADETQIESDVVRTARRTYDLVGVTKDVRKIIQIADSKKIGYQLFEHKEKLKFKHINYQDYQEFHNKVKNVELNCEINGEKVNSEYSNLKNVINQKFPPEKRKSFAKQELQKKRPKRRNEGEKNIDVVTVAEQDKFFDKEVNLKKAIKSGDKKLEMNIKSTEFKANIMTDKITTYNLKKVDVKTQVKNGLSTGTEINRTKVAKDVFKKQVTQYRKEIYKKNFRNQVLNKAKSGAKKGVVNSAITESTKAISTVVGGKAKVVIAGIIIAIMLIFVIFGVIIFGVGNSAGAIFGQTSTDKKTETEKADFNEEIWLREKIKKSMDDLVQEIKDIVDDNKDNYSSIQLVNGLYGNEITIDDNSILKVLYTEEEYYKKIQSIFHIVLLAEYDLESTESQRTKLYDEIWDTLTYLEQSEKTIEYSSGNTDVEDGESSEQGEDNLTIPNFKNDTDDTNQNQEGNLIPDFKPDEEGTDVVSSKILEITINLKGFNELTKKYFTNRIDELKAKTELSMEEKQELSELESYYEICLEYLDNLGGEAESGSGGGIGGITDFSGLEKLSSVPYYCQWDDSWGSIKYGGGTISSSGCGPTCCAMVMSYYTGMSITPDTIVDEVGNKYYVPGVGSSWSLFPAVSQMCGVQCTDLGKNISAMVEALRSGNVVIASMKSGTFTSATHFIVLTGITADGKITVNDPNHPQFCTKTFDTSIFEAEARNYWKFSK